MGRRGDFEGAEWEMLDKSSYLNNEEGVTHAVGLCTVKDGPSGMSVRIWGKCFMI